MDQDGGTAAAAPAIAEPALTRLDPNYIWILRAHSLVVLVPLLAGAVFLGETLEALRWLPLLLVLIVGAIVLWRVPLRRFSHRGYNMGADRLRIVKGFLFYSDTVVPFGRVQHIDLTRGPLERFLGLATLILHTAGTHNASITLPGLAQEDAEAMRETIRQHIKREMM
ncbi:PH domain-containing protein [Altericroceibacterium endophyticum]|uniref:PH domain-containing protein n=1 Tax=Altericroceibacterium endophyticum TaxID=1808508 RepID=A0A6I4T2S3_9SPHN|nr:PH domain-containing protein [Altericroceibacterium endophyticum]MXO64290.1 PH domain-containing protein [Altericroceibacterium endophyticum]